MAVIGGLSSAPQSHWGMPVIGQRLLRVLTVRSARALAGCLHQAVTAHIIRIRNKAFTRGSLAQSHRTSGPR